LDLLVLLDLLVHLDFKEIMEQQDLLDLLVQPLMSLDLLVLKVKQVQQDLKERLVLLAL
jgi:hypothetical protein